VGWISEPTAKKLLAAAGSDSSALAKADIRGFKGFPLHCKFSTSLKVKVEYNKSHNVIGKITGTKHPDEYIIYTAHWDHLGIGKPVNGDSIYNGALDNGSGTAGLLELGRAFKSVKPERTIVILAVTAEEQGLQGSAWYAQNPIYPLNKTLANINIDGLNWYGKTNDISIVGQGQSELEDILKDEAAKTNRVISYDVHPEAGHYYRSDHFNFAKVGVPAIFANPGVDVIGKGKDYGKQRDDDYTANRYHAPSDQFDSTWDLSGAVADLQLLYNVGMKLSSADKFPEWKPTSEFKAVRDKSLQGK
jgi:Zn-dependent M28 family amino/carboxypeptidase